MPLSVRVLSTPGHDCTNGGLSSKVRSLTLLNVDGPSTVTADAPAALLVKGATDGIARIVPADADTGEALPGWFMFGGNFAHTSDSRFSHAVEAITEARFYGAVCIHDRQE